MAGEEPFMGIVAGITPGPTTLVTCVEDERLEFQVRTAALRGRIEQRGAQQALSKRCACARRMASC